MMRFGLSLTSRHGWCVASLAVLSGLTPMRGDDSSPTASSAGAGWSHYDWLETADVQQRQAASGGTFSATAGQDIRDPQSVVSTGSLWQDRYGVTYTRKFSEGMFLSYETGATMLSPETNPWFSAGDDVYRAQKVAAKVQPFEGHTLEGNVHDATADTATPGISSLTTGTGFSAAARLPFQAELTLGMNSDHTRIDVPGSSNTETNSYDAQLRQPIGSLPLTAVFKGHYDQISTPAAPTPSLPSLEQAFVWKPAQETTVQTGLRQQQFQVFPGDRNDFNDTLFADWSQAIVGNVTWHSYAEILNSRTTEDAAPIVPLASGANGTPQAAASPGSSPLAMPSLTSQSFTFSTGPSFKLQKDLSASIEYSDRWDQTPAAGSTGQEQRVSVSVKGSF